MKGSEISFLLYQFVMGFLIVLVLASTIVKLIMDKYVAPKVAFNRLYKAIEETKVTGSYEFTKFDLPSKAIVQCYATEGEESQYYLVLLNTSLKNAGIESKEGIAYGGIIYCNNIKESIEEKRAIPLPIYYSNDEQMNQKVSEKSLFIGFDKIHLASLTLEKKEKEGNQWIELEIVYRWK